MFTPKLNPIRQEMMKDLSKQARMDSQNTLNLILDTVYSDVKLRKSIFKR